MCTGIRGWTWRWSAWGERRGLLPVVNRADVHQVIGIVTLRDVLAAYGVGAGTRG